MCIRALSHPNIYYCRSNLRNSHFSISFSVSFRMDQTCVSAEQACCTDFVTLPAATLQTKFVEHRPTYRPLDDRRAPDAEAARGSSENM